VTNRCPFCGNYAYAASVGDAYRMDCRYCEIQVEITKRAYAARCPNPVAVLDYIREKMKASTRPRVDLADMKRTGPALAIEVDNVTSSDDVLTTTAKAIGSTLGKIAVRTGIAKPEAEVPKVQKRKASPKKKEMKTSATKAASPKKKIAPPAKAKKPSPRGKKAK